MQLSCVAKLAQRPAADVLVVPIWQGKKGGQIASLEFAGGEALRHPLKSGDFQGKEGEMLFLYPARNKEKRILLLGLGDEKKCIPDQLRRAYGTSTRMIRSKKLANANFLMPKMALMDEQLGSKAIFEGVMLGRYVFDHLKGEKEDQVLLGKVCFCGVRVGAALLLKRCEVVVSSVNFVRDLVNGNADDVNTSTLIQTARELGQFDDRIKVTVFDKKRLEKEKMGLLLAVGRAALHDPALIFVEYRGAPKSKDLTAVVGKGVTYDTGGLNMKSGPGMETMKCDMAGAAAALGALRAAAELKLKCNLIVVMAAAENAIGPASYKPGDVYRSYSGTTVQIGDTDAEGRLVLADALAYVQDKYKPTRLIDLATLTGGVIIALGEEITGLFSNDEKLAKLLMQAGERTHERLWRLPLLPEYKEYLKSSIADLKNAGIRRATPSLGAMFLQHFIKNVPWAHLDIAGTAYLSEPKSYNPTPATGMGVRLLIDFLEHLHAKGE